MRGPREVAASASPFCTSHEVRFPDKNKEEREEEGSTALSGPPRPAVPGIHRAPWGSPDFHSYPRNQAIFTIKLRCYLLFNMFTFSAKAVLAKMSGLSSNQGSDT